MSFFRERQSRNFFLGIVIISLLLLLFGGIISASLTQTVKKLLLSNEAAFVDSLLTQGISPDTIASAVANPKDSGKGGRLLEQLGYTEKTSARFLPEVSGFEATALLSVLTGSFLFGLLLLALCIVYLSNREKLFNKARKTVLQFAEGNFAAHLPRVEEGTLYQLFAAVDNLATALQSKSEAEHQARQFLKNTISDISHQLKTPLAALAIYNDIMINEPHNVTVITEFSQKTAAALGRMEQLIQSLLKITRLDAGSIVFEKDSYLISEIVAQATEELVTRAALESKQLSISGEHNGMITCDFHWTSEAIGNIVKNALDYTEPDGHIRIFWERSPTMVRISITDDGEGIEQEDIHHIFKRFYRSKNTAESNGIGLGLPLAKAIVEGQGGVLSVQSMRGRGTTFTLSFLTGL